MAYNFENLNKQNFFDEMHLLYPKAVDKFTEWIDGYKSANNWDSIFQEGIEFHNIPYELQMGIMNRFFIEAFTSNEEYYVDGQRGAVYHSEMRDAMCKLNKFIK